MKFALIDSERREAQPHLSGTCPCCGNPTVAKCGEERISHWAHRGKCDPWWENETEWHRTWKGQFPKEWQEIVHFGENDEKHIADVKTDQGFVLEFQHSHLVPQERVIREAFYQNMVWVVDGTRLKKDYPRFLEGRKHFRSTALKGFFLVHFPEEYFPAAWIESSVEVLFDFQGTLSTDPQDWTRNLLWCLLPGRARGCAVVSAISRQDFVTAALRQSRLFRDPAHEFVNAFDKLLTDQEKIEEQRSQRQEWKPRKRTWRL